jgi:hypothetical protein
VRVCVCVCVCVCIVYINIYRYADGKAHIKWHADSESCYGDSHSSTIASVSFGAPRVFCLRRKLQDEEVCVWVWVCGCVCPCTTYIT